MSAFGKKGTNQNQSRVVDNETPDSIKQRRQAIAAQYNVSDSNGIAEPILTGLAAEKAVGALCFLPKSIHRLATRAAEDRDLTAKRFFLETILIGLEQQGVITAEQHEDALKLPSEYGWKGRKSLSDSSSSSSY